MIFILALIPFSHPFWGSLPTPSIPDWDRVEERLSIASYANVGDGIYMDGEVTSISEPFSFYKNGYKVVTDLYYLGGGFMDSSIDSWHDFWNLPLGDRPNMPENQVSMSFEDDGNVLWQVTDSGFGISPLRVSKDIEKDLVLKAVFAPGVGPLNLYSDPSFAIYKKYKYGKWLGEYGGGWFGGLDIDKTEGTGFFAFSAFREKKIHENIFNFGINNHHRWITLSQHFFGLAVVLCHKKTYDSWPVEVREIVNASIKKATDAQRKLAAAEEKEVLERFDLSNNEIITLGDTERLEFASTVKPVIDNTVSGFRNKLFDFISV